MMTVSSPQAAGCSKVANSARFRFAGKEVTEQYLAQFRQFPDDTFKRIADIAHVSRHQGPAHIRLAKQYAKVDPNLASMNHVVTTDVSTRDRNKKTDPETSSNAAEHLKDFRQAVAIVLAEKGYPEDGQELEESERNRLLQPAPVNTSLIQGVIDRTSALWATVRSMFS